MLDFRVLGFKMLGLDVLPKRGGMLSGFVSDIRSEFRAAGGTLRFHFFRVFF